MQQQVVADQSLIGAVAKIDTGHFLQIVGAPLAGIGDGISVRCAHHLLEARVVAGVAIEGAVVAARLATVALGLLSGEQFLVLQHADNVDHRLRVVAGLRQIFGAEAVGLQLMLTAVARGPGLGQRLQQGRARLVAHPRHQDGAEHRAQPCCSGRTLLADAVACGDVADFVADHARQFGLGIQIGHETARDVDIAAGQRKRVDVGAVDHGEVPVQRRPVALLRQVLADFVHVGLQRRVVQSRVFLQHILMRLCAELNFLLLRHQHEVLVARDRILGAVAQRQRTQGNHGSSAYGLGFHAGRLLGLRRGNNTVAVAQKSKKRPKPLFACIAQTGLLQAAVDFMP